MKKKYRRLHPFLPQTLVLRGLITHSNANTEIEQIANVHEISHHVHEMFTVYPLKIRFHKAHDKLTNS